MMRSAIIISPNNLLQAVAELNFLAEALDEGCHLKPQSDGSLLR